MSEQYSIFSVAWDDFRRDIDLAELDIDPDQVFAGVRDDAPVEDESIPPSS